MAGTDDSSLDIKAAAAWQGYRQVLFSGAATIFRGPNVANQKTCGNNARGGVRDVLRFESEVAPTV